MSTYAIIRRNILSNWSGFLVQVLVAFLLTPYIVNALGNTYYGIWALVVSLTGYYGLLDVGVSAGLTQYVARYYAQKNFERLNETVSTGFLILTVCAAVLLVVSVGLALLANRVFGFGGTTAQEVQRAILIMGGGAALQFPFFSYSTIFPATQRFDVSNAIGIGTRLLSAVWIYWALKRGDGLVGVSIATTACNLLDYLLRFVIAYRLLPALRVSPKLVRIARARELAHFGAWNFVISSSVQIVAYSSTVVIAIFLPPAAITPFALASSLNGYFMRMFIPIGQVFFPVFAEHDARGENKAIKSLYLNGTRLLALLALPAGVLLYGLSDEFFSLWIGPAAKGGDYPSAAVIFDLLIVASVMSALQRVSYQVLLGTRRLKLMATCFMIEGGSNLVLSVLLVGPIGLYGVALGTVVPALIIEGVMIPRLICRLYSISLADYLTTIVARASLVAFLLYLALCAIKIASPPDTWLGLTLDAAIAAAIFTVLIFTLGISREERRRLLSKPIGSLGRKTI